MDTDNRRATEPQHTEDASVTTTHAEWGAGDPHLIVTGEKERFVFPLHEDVTRVGSQDDLELTLTDTADLHATITHDRRDEYVLTLHAPGEMNANPHAAGTHPGERTETLRTGAHFTAGPWRLVYERAEYADHGRPYGGRQGGEFSDQPPQPARPDYTDAGGMDLDDDRPLEVQND